MLNSQSRPLNCLARAARTGYRKRSDKVKICSSDILTCLWRWFESGPYWSPILFPPEVGEPVRCSQSIAPTPAWRSAVLARGFARPCTQRNSIYYRNAADTRVFERHRRLFSVMGRAAMWPRCSRVVRIKRAQRKSCVEITGGYLGQHGQQRQGGRQSSDQTSGDKVCSRM